MCYRHTIWQSVLVRSANLHLKYINPESGIEMKLPKFIRGSLKRDVVADLKSFGFKFNRSLDQWGEYKPCEYFDEKFNGLFTPPLKRVIFYKRLGDLAIKALEDRFLTIGSVRLKNGKYEPHEDKGVFARS